MELSIIIPTYNEAGRLLPALDKLFDHLYAHYHGDYEVIVADDGSTDRTVALARADHDKHPQLQVMAFPHNRGRGAAVRDAVFSAHGTFILEMDADGSVNVDAVTTFLKYFARHPEVHVLVGSRMMPGAKIVTPQPWYRIMLGWGFVLCAKLLFGWPLIDRVNGYKMFRRAAAEDIFRHQFENGFIAEAEIVYVAERRGWTVCALPISWTDFRGSRVRPFLEIGRSLGAMLRILGRDRRGHYRRHG